MDIGLYRDNIVKRLQDTADATMSMAMNLQPRFASPGIAAMTSDEYAMTQVNYLSTARAMMEAIKVVEHEYKVLTQPEKKPEPESEKPKKGNVY